MPSPRRAAVLGGNRIPFARQFGAYAEASNQDMLTSAIEGLVARHGLAGERLGEVVASRGCGGDAADDLVLQAVRDRFGELGSREVAARLRTACRLARHRLDRLPRHPRGVVREELHQVTELRIRQERVVQRQLLPPPDHALQLGPDRTVGVGHQSDCRMEKRRRNSM